MQKDFIQFKKQRELGGILSDTFKFIRQEGKQLFGLILKIAGPALIVLITAYLFYMSTTLGGFGSIDNSDPFANFTGNAILALFIVMFSAVAYYALLYGTILSYVRSYMQNNGVVNEAEVRTNVKKRFWSLIGLSFLVSIMTVVGLIFCVIPGIYLGTVLMTTYAIHIFEDRDVTDAISYSFDLIKGEWWITFATILVVGIIYYFVLFIFQIPAVIYSMVKIFTVIDQVGANPEDIFDWVYIALNALAQIAQYILHSILVIAAAFIYFNLNEKKNFTGTMETIDALGNQE